MTTLQEAALTALAFIRWNEFGECHTPGFPGPPPTAAEAAEALEEALAQQGGQQPVCAGCGIPAGDVHMSTCQSGKWPSRVSNGDTAAPAPQAQPATSDEWLANCPQEVRDFANKLKAAPQAPFNEPDAAMWLTKNKLAQHDLLSAPQAQEPVAQPLIDDAKLGD